MEAKQIILNMISHRKKKRSRGGASIAKAIGIRKQQRQTMPVVDQKGGERC